ncbi:MAG: BREX system P-loop protein BrxC, partial [Pseudomonadota bacterium]
MKLTDVLHRDPARHPLVNQGQARIADKTTDKALEELRGELSTFVCEGQFADGLQRILSSFLAGLNQTSQKASWVSGFFGSGKSHLLKMACHLWQDTRFPDGATARSLVPDMPEELRNLLRELDTAGKRSGGLVAAAGALPSGSTDNVRLTVLGILFRGLDLPEQYPQAMFSLWLYEQEWFDQVKSIVEQASKNWTSELNNLYVSGLIARAVLQCDPTFAANEVEARKTIREQFPQRTTDITTEQFLTAFRRALKLRSSNGRWPCTLLVLDEVQQYIGDSNDRSTMVTEVAEAICKQLDSHVMVIGAGQSALTDSRYLQKLMDRFTIRVPLSDTDVETVTRKVLLQKKPSAIPLVGQFLDAHGGEISRQLQGTRIGETASDRDTIVDDYPLLPVRRRFWEQCFRQVDAAGTQSQLRSQLRIIHDAVARLSDKELGAVVPGDDLFDALAPEMVNTGVLLRELNERIINLSKDGTEASRLARRVSGLVFLVSKLPRQDGVDIGVRATKEHLADLLV